MIFGRKSRRADDLAALVEAHDRTLADRQAAERAVEEQGPALKAQREEIEVAVTTREITEAAARKELVEIDGKLERLEAEPGRLEGLLAALGRRVVEAAVDAEMQLVRDVEARLGPLEQREADLQAELVRVQEERDGARREIADWQRTGEALRERFDPELRRQLDTRGIQEREAARSIAKKPKKFWDVMSGGDEAVMRRAQAIRDREAADDAERRKESEKKASGRAGLVNAGRGNR